MSANDRLDTTDEKGHRVFLYPDMVRGYFRNLRTWVYSVLMLIFLVLPWTKINGQQTLLIDIADRRYAFFGLSLGAHNTPLVFFILTIFVISLVLITALWGRLWCGWACPQTVFIDLFFRRIESWIDGNYLQQRKLAKAPLTFRKLGKRLLKWTIFSVLCLLIANSFIAYFVGADDLIKMIARPPSENWLSFLSMLFVYLVVLFDFGWFREQFCIIMCPYGRFQSVLMDKHSLAVTYDVKRGEPRGKVAKGAIVAKGDCIDCKRCVNVCPTGIDIRDGLQMECIACTACIDACDEIMDKIKRPRGLIRYDGGPLSFWQKVKSPRVIGYTAVLMLLVGGISYSLAYLEPINLTVLRAKDLPYRELENQPGQFINHFKVHLTSNSLQDLNVSLDAVDLPLRTKLIFPFPTLELKAGKQFTGHFFVQFQSTSPIKLRLMCGKKVCSATQTIQLVKPN